jgi:hypothetical protein
MVKDSPLGGIEWKAESWRDEIHFTAQGPNSRRKRVDAHKTAATFPDVQRNGGDELKRHLFQGLRNRRIGSLGNIIHYRIPVFEVPCAFDCKTLASVSMDTRSAFKLHRTSACLQTIVGKSAKCVPFSRESAINRAGLGFSLHMFSLPRKLSRYRQK